MDITLLKQKGQHLADSFLNENLALSTRLADRRGLGLGLGLGDVI